LLDAAHGRAVKSWRFRGQPEIAIGRMPECDIAIDDPYVSRLHAQLRFSAGQWLLVSRGRNGVVVRNERITEMPLAGEMTFQLGTTGPLLRFCVARDESECGRTLSFDADQTPLFALDAAKLNDDVDQIAAGEYFQNLQAKAQALRAGRHA